MIKFTFKQSSCVAVGTFNIYIVQPKLLVDMGVFHLEQPVLVSGDLTQPGLRFDVQKSKWTVRPDRLSVETEDAEVDCGKFLQKTLEALCWTPIMAVGINCVFEAPPGSEEKLPDDLRLPRHPNASQRSVHFCVPHENSHTNIQLFSSENALTLAVNRHADFSKTRDDPEKVSQGCSIDLQFIFAATIRVGRYSNQRGFRSRII